MRLMKSDSMSYQGTEPLSNDVLRRYAPSIFASEPHSSRSDRFGFSSTIEMVEGLRGEGFMPFFVAQQRTRNESKREFTKHMIRYRRADQMNASEALEIIHINGHDGSAAAQLIGGCLVSVCTNGLICGDSIERIHVPHRSNCARLVIEGAYSMLAHFEKIRGAIDGMKTLQLTSGEQNAFAEAALQIRYDDPEKPAPITPARALQPRRVERDPNSLWSTFNRVEENLSKGGQTGVNAQGQRRATRQVNSITGKLGLERALWTLAEKMAELKGGTN